VNVPGSGGHVAPWQPGTAPTPLPQHDPVPIDPNKTPIDVYDDDPPSVYDSSTPIRRHPYPRPKLPQMPPGLTEAQKKKFFECMVRHKDKDFRQYKRGEADIALKTCDPKDKCKKLRDAIRAAQAELDARNGYDLAGCDEFDYYKEGRTEQERRESHRTEIKNREERIEKLKKQFDVECPKNR